MREYIASAKQAEQVGGTFEVSLLPSHLSGQSLWHLIPLPMTNQMKAQPAPLLHELCAD